VGLGGVPAGCGVRIPLPVRRAWHVPNCATAASPRPPISHQRAAAGTVGDLVDIALAQVGVLDNPPETALPPQASEDCSPYATLVGYSTPTCGTTTSNGSWFSDVENVNQLWCSNFAKWVWEQAGVTSDLGTLTANSANFYTWGEENGENITFNNTPQVGDAVLFYPAGTQEPTGAPLAADHVGIVTAVNSDGSLNLVNGDFLESNGVGSSTTPMSQVLRGMPRARNGPSYPRSSLVSSSNTAPTVTA
jgi:hypothetical protein